MLLGILVVAMAGGTLTMALSRGGTTAPTPVVTPKPAVPVKPSPASPAATSAATPSSTAAAVPRAAVASGPAWTQANREWLWNPKKGVAFQLLSVNRVGIWQGQAQPMLVVRCEAGRMQMFVFTASALKMETEDENHTVRLRFDEQPEAVERWADSSDHDALFAPDSAAFARRVAGAQIVKVGYTPHNASPATAEFHVGGLGEMLGGSARACGWKP